MEYLLDMIDSKYLIGAAVGAGGLITVRGALLWIEDFLNGRRPEKEWNRPYYAVVDFKGNRMNGERIFLPARAKEDNVYTTRRELINIHTSFNGFYARGNNNYLNFESKDNTSYYVSEYKFIKGERNYRNDVIFRPSFSNPRKIMIHPQIATGIPCLPQKRDLPKLNFHLEKFLEYMRALDLEVKGRIVGVA